MVPGVICADRENWGRHLDIVRSLRCFAKKVLYKYRALNVCLTYKDVKDVDHFRKGSVLGLYILESQPGKLMLKFSREITTKLIAVLTTNR